MEKSGRSRAISSRDRPLSLKRSTGWVWPYFFFGGTRFLVPAFAVARFAIHTSRSAPQRGVPPEGGHKTVA